MSTHFRPSEPVKRKVPPSIQKLLKFDQQLTEKFNFFANEVLPLRSLRISCHGIPWFAFWIAFTWLFNNPSLIQLQINMLIGLLLDIILIAVAKAYFRRKRPEVNRDDALGQIGPDVFSFPSGHASRAVFVTYFFLWLYPLNFIVSLFVVLWCVSVCLSRVLMLRHYILDVLGGIALGLFVGFTVGLIWLSDDSSKYLMSFLSDEKTDGGDYHV